MMMQTVVMLMMMKSVKEYLRIDTCESFSVPYRLLKCCRNPCSFSHTGSQKPRVQRRNSPRHPKQPVVGRAHARRSTALLSSVAWRFC